MGKVRPEHVKRIARELLNRYPQKFTDNFEENKRIVDEFTDVKTKKLRNRVAGYTTQLVLLKLSEDDSEQPVDRGETEFDRIKRD